MELSHFNWHFFKEIKRDHGNRPKWFVVFCSTSAQGRLFASDLKM